MTHLVRPDRPPLAGATVIVTRPSASAPAAMRAARRLGAAAVRLPGVGVRAIADRDGALRALTTARDADAWIFTSPAAVRFAFHLLPSLRPRRGAQVFAIGSGTARALRRHALEGRHPEHRQDSTGLLDMADLQSTAGWRIVIIDAPGGRDLLAPALRRRGARVERIGVYERTAPRLDMRHLRALAAARRPWLTLLSSGEALDHLLAALPAALVQRWRAEVLIVSSARLAGLAAERGFERIHVARSATMPDLLDAAVEVHARRARR